MCGSRGLGSLRWGRCGGFASVSVGAGQCVCVVCGDEVYSSVWKFGVFCCVFVVDARVDHGGGEFAKSFY